MLVVVRVFVLYVGLCVGGVTGVRGVSVVRVAGVA